MMDRARAAGRPLTHAAIACCSLALLSACSTSTTVAEKPTRSKEYFAESEYGVQASPRVSHLASDLPRGGGREQVGKPYQIRGKWYYPEVDPDYEATGLASWYGDAFHGRLTANGEVYDMTHLTAAHPTMPLPSYARVTNEGNGSSVIVRVNDRGPFAHNRIIDLSKRAAELLDYKNGGVATVTVEYVGPAPLHGRDDAYLMASYQPGGLDGNDGLPAGVMMAMNGATPTAPVAAASVQLPAAVPFPGELVTTVPESAPVLLPAEVPLAPARPSIDVAAVKAAGGLLGYAAAARPSSPALESFDAHRLGPAQEAEAYIAVGTYGSQMEAFKTAARLTALGAPRIVADETGEWFSVELGGAAGISMDDMLRQVWASGASDAFIVR